MRARRTRQNSGPSARLVCILCLGPASAAAACHDATASEPRGIQAPAPAPSTKASPTPAPMSKATGAAGSAGPRTADAPADSAKAAGSADATKPPTGSASSPERAYAKTRYVWIREFPDSSTQWIGYLWNGGSVALRSDEPVVGPGCETWYPVVPRGYVCIDGERVTRDPKDPVLRAVARYSPKVDTPWPHLYAESHGVERYAELPDEKVQRMRERGHEWHLERVAAVRRGEAEPWIDGLDLLPSGHDPIEFSSLPRDLQIKRNYLKRRSTIAYSHEVDYAGRTWLLTADFMWIPKDRVELYPVVTYRGVHLDGGVELPVALFRQADRPKYKRSDAGEMVPTSEHFARLSWVQLTGKRVEKGETTYLETAEPGVYTTTDDAVVPEPRGHTPWGAEVGRPDDTEHQPAGRQTWIEASVLGGYLIAYEGTRPVFVTLISPGRGGTPVPGKEPVETASTPTGRFNITGKFATANMESPAELIHSDVPWTQNFSGPHALHGAYWHDDWGKLKSGGCINVSPIDGKWLYEFTEPAVPPGWHAVRWEPRRSPSTTLIVHR